MPKSLRALAFITPALLLLLSVAPAPVTAAATTVSADIIVYGGTPAGVLAAVTAKRADKRLVVVLLEPTRHLGGMVSNGLGFTDIGTKSTVGGYTKEFFDRVQRAEGTADGRWHFEPHAAERALRDMLHTTGVSVRYSRRLRETTGVVKVGTRITTITMTNGEIYQARTFIDASYEGDLMAQAGVSYRVGRESQTEFGESLAGVTPARAIMTLPAGAALPYANEAPGPVGSADDRVQDSNYRICFSSVRANQTPFAKPLGYVVSDYDVVLAYIRQRAAETGQAPALNWMMHLAPVANHKFDVNNYGLMSTAVTGLNHGYVEASYAQRAALDTRHRRWAKGLLYFLRYDPRVPYAIRSTLSKYGLCKDEFTDYNNWPRQLYLREGRRMVGQYVLRQRDIEWWRTKVDIIGVASYRIDAHFVSRWVDATGRVWTEGALRAPRYEYAIPYRIMLPQASEVTNLLVPVASSTTHVAQSSLRMEPQYMMMGEAAGQAAAMTIRISTTTSGMRKSVIAVGAVDIMTLRARLKAHGVYLAQPKNG